ncbi:MAG: TSUP family transporter [Burkholderiaceae bacterium]|nr:TSUP family transporter [Burkholderiaceae bacterium]
MLTLSLAQLALLGTGAALGGLVFGVMGFAYGVVVSLFIHHGFAAADVVFIVVGGALALNVGLLPRFRRELRWRSAAPSLAGAALGLPLGLWLLARLDVGTIRAIVALVIIGYGVFALRRHGLAPLRFEPARLRVVDGLVGFAGGVVGGICGLGPLVPAVWFGLRGLEKMEQRALAQCYGLCVQGAMVAWLLASSTVSRDAVEGLLLALPVMLAGAWLGLQGFERLGAPVFRQGVVLLAIAGAAVLLVRQL